MTLVQFPGIVPQHWTGFHEHVFAMLRRQGHSAMSAALRVEGMIWVGRDVPGETAQAAELRRRREELGVLRVAAAFERGDLTCMQWRVTHPELVEVADCLMPLAGRSSSALDRPRGACRNPRAGDGWRRAAVISFPRGSRARTGVKPGAQS